jgi:hypothetical protein
VRVPLPQARIAGIEHEVAGDALGPVATGVLAGMEQAEIVAVLRFGAHGASIAPWRVRKTLSRD